MAFWYGKYERESPRERERDVLDQITDRIDSFSIRDRTRREKYDSFPDRDCEWSPERRCPLHTGHEQYRREPYEDGHLEGRGRPGSQRPLSKVSNPPRTLHYDGKTNWAAFSTKFGKYAKASQLSSEECKDTLCWCLEGKASEYYALVMEQSPDFEFYDLMQRFEKQFGLKELLETAAIRFDNARQFPEESLDDWADRVLSLATKAFRELPEQYMYRKTTLRFCLGCSDREAGESVANQRPRSIEDALDKIRWAIHMHNPIHGRSWKEVREVALEEDIIPDKFATTFRPSGTSLSPRVSFSLPKMKEEGKQSMEDPEKRIRCLENKMDKMVSKTQIESLERRMMHMESAVHELGNNMKRVMNDLARMRWASRRRSPSPSPNNDIKSFRCKSEDHFIRNCPVEASEGERPKVVKAVSFEESLNLQGSREEAISRPRGKIRPMMWLK
ncbi:uncharacterized protein LOC128213533 [Mya arenaria]|uniref:uncharacterized protein LOC128213533 n=1 Tax=Mya arenaria TaxID=6604 RepID=UPI0022E5479B|nr:uncharacterized protein LOC128213533 [Mya arenaria]